MSSLSAQVIHWGSPRPEGAPLYYHGDHLGSTRLLSGYNGYPISSSIFLPYGEEFNSQTTVNHYKFTGKERDSETGLDNFGARYYAGTMGRFMQADEFAGGPVEVGGDPTPPGPLPYADITNPQSLNKYSYTYNNPLRYTDPDGHCPDSNPLCAFLYRNTVDQISSQTTERVVQGLEGVGQIAGGTVITAGAIASIPETGGASAALVLSSTVGVIGGEGLIASGVANVVAAVTGKGGAEARTAGEAVETITNPAGYTVTVGTGGNLEAGKKGAAVYDILTSKPGGNAAETVQSVTQGIKGVQTLIIPPRQNRKPNCEETGSCD
jgi:RHS repeat-associated protein